MMRVERLTTVAEFDALLPEWRALEERARIQLPFLSATWARQWWAHFAIDSLSLRDRLELRAIRVKDGTLVGVAPLMLTERPSIGPLRLRVLQFFGSDPNVTELRGALFDPAHEREAATALVDDLAASSGQRDWLRWSGIRAGSGAEEALRETAKVSWEESPPNYLLPLPASWEELRGKLPRNIKEALRKCYNSLKREGFIPRLEVARSPAEVSAALDVFLRLHGDRAASDRGTRHLNVFDSARARDFMRALCAELSARGEARVYLLHIGDEVVSARVAFLRHGHLYLYYSGFEAKWGRFSVPTTLVAETIRHSIEEKLEAVNFSFGTDVSKLRWRPLEIRYSEGVQSSPNARSLVLRAGFRLAQRTATRVAGWGQKNRFVRLIAGHLPLARSFEHESGEPPPRDE